MHSWHPQLTRFLFRDVVVNISIYIPLGFAAFFVFRKIHWPLLSLYGPVLLGMLLSTAVELTQLFTPHRDTNLLDVIANVIGSALGVMVAILFEKTAGPLPRRFHLVPIDRSALMLVFCWAAWLVFPFFPIFGHQELYRKISVFVHSPAFTAVSFVSAAAVWYTLGLLLNAAGIRRSADIAWPFDSRDPGSVDYRGQATRAIRPPRRDCGIPDVRIPAAQQKR